MLHCQFQARFLPMKNTPLNPEKPADAQKLKTPTGHKSYRKFNEPHVYSYRYKFVINYSSIVVYCNEVYLRNVTEPLILEHLPEAARNRQSHRKSPLS